MLPPPPPPGRPLQIQTIACVRPLLTDKAQAISPKYLCSILLSLQIAAALQAEKLILMTDVPGVLRDKDDVATKFNSLNIRECRQLTEEGIIAGGMIPKVRILNISGIAVPSNHLVFTWDAIRAVLQVQCCIRCLSPPTPTANTHPASLL